MNTLEGPIGAWGNLVYNWRRQLNQLLRMSYSPWKRLPGERWEFPEILMAWGL